MEKVSVEIDARWIRRINSKGFGIISALQGVAITFCPLYIYFAGTMGILQDHPLLKWIVLIASFATIYVVGLVHIKIATEMVTALRKPRV